MRSLWSILALLMDFSLHAATVREHEVRQIPSTERQCIIPDGFVGIWNREGLESIRSNLKGRYFLCSPLELHSEFMPLGNVRPDGSIEYFEGIFDGNGLSISGLRINQPEMNQVGLFRGIHSTAKVLNLRLVDAIVTGRTMVGSIAGVSQGSLRRITVINSHIGSNQSEIVGGILGVLNSASLHSRASLKESSVFGGSIRGLHSTGGLVGKSNAGEIRESATETQIVSITSASGGVTGQYSGSNVIEGDGIFDSISRSSLTGGGPALGGIVGLLSNGALIERAYSETKISTAGGRGGCIVGQALGSKIIDSYFKMEFCQSIHPWEKPLPQLNGIMLEEYKIPIAHQFDFKKIWFLDDLVYPRLRAVD